MQFRPRSRPLRGPAAFWVATKTACGSNPPPATLRGAGVANSCRFEQPGGWRTQREARNEAQREPDKSVDLLRLGLVQHLPLRAAAVLQQEREAFFSNLLLKFCEAAPFRRAACAWMSGWQHLACFGRVAKHLPRLADLPKSANLGYN